MIMLVFNHACVLLEAFHDQLPSTCGTHVLTRRYTSFCRTHTWTTAVAVPQHAFLHLHSSECLWCAATPLHRLLRNSAATHAAPRM